MDIALNQYIQTHTLSLKQILKIALQLSETLRDRSNHCIVNEAIRTIAPFPLGQRDICDRFSIPEKLYGRQQEVKTLLDAFDRISQGNTELILVAGFSGIGKTAVVHEVHKPIVSHRGYFVQGKFDRFNRNIPFSGFVQALRSLMRQLITENSRQLAQWKQPILTAVGENGQVLIEVIPELEYIIGPQPPAPELSGIATQNRFHLLFQKFIQVFTTPDHPLIIFLDDLQWADSASLKLMQVLMEESQKGYLLLIGAYRDNEVFPTHPLMLALEDILTTRATLHTIILKPLSLASLNQLIADTLACTFQRAQPLTDLVHKKTKGNPFLATQFLKALHQEELIKFDRQLGHWECDIIKVWEAALTDDAVEFMVQQLQKLPTETQLELYEAAAESKYLNTNFEESKKTIDLILEKAKTTLEKVKIYEMPIQSYTAQNRFIESTPEAVIINDIEATSNFAGDRFWQIESVKGLLCTPVLTPGKLVAILALKNHLTANSFTPDRIELLNFLYTQAAISLENVRLYAAAEQKSARLQASLNELQESEVRFRLLFEQSTDAIFLIEGNQFIACNSTCLTLFGYDDIDVFFNKHLGDVSPEFQPDGQLSLEKANQLIATAFEVGSNQFEWVYQRANRENFWADIVLTMIPYKNKSIIHAVIRDISDRKRAEEEIRRSEATLREKNLALEQTLKTLQQTQLQIVQNEKMLALGNLVAGVAHEINNPVSFLAGNIQPALEYIQDLLGLVDLYQNKFPDPGPEIQEEVEAIDLEYLREDLPKLISSLEEGVNRIRNISTSLRTFSRTDRDYKVPFNIHDGLDSTLSILKHRLKANEFRPAISMVRNYGNLPSISCFPGQINQVFMNILSNAIDALEEANEGRSFSEIQANPNYITIQTTALEPNQIFITIADNGIGMKAEIQQRVFDHLFTTKAVGKGTGLGLAIAYQIVVESHGGNLTVDSTYWEGTQFTIALPL